MIAGLDLQALTDYGGIILSPSRDVLFFSMDYTDDPYYSDQLE